MESNDKHTETKKVVQKLKTEIKEKEKQLSKVQDDCIHPSEKIAVQNVDASGGRAEFRKVCQLCGKVVGYPSQGEIQDEVGI